MGEFSAWHLLILAGVFVLLFGAKRLPDGARSLGRSLRIFKTEVKGLNDDEAAQAQAQLPPATTAAAPPAATPPTAPTTAPTAAPSVAAPPTMSEADAAQQHEAR